jgi:hypothetical protein
MVACACTGGTGIGICRIFDRLIDARLTLCFPFRCPTAADCVGRPGKQSRLDRAIDDARAKYVILMDAIIYLAAPNPTARQLVSVAPFVHQDITWQETKCFGSAGRGADSCHVAQIKSTSLNIRHPQVGHFDEFWIRLLLGVLGDTSDDSRYFTEALPTPANWKVH